MKDLSSKVKMSIGGIQENLENRLSKIISLIQTNLQKMDDHPPYYFQVLLECRQKLLVLMILKLSPYWVKVLSEKFI